MMVADWFAIRGAGCACWRVVHLRFLETLKRYVPSATLDRFQRRQSMMGEGSRDHCLDPSMCL